MFKRFKIIKDCGKYGNTGKFIVLDRKKLFTFLRDKQYTHEVFDTKEQAEGFIFGKKGLKHVEIYDAFDSKLEKRKKQEVLNA